ncbi:pseudouridine-5'-phosphatase-like [Atheta coriaria]|uniref:pseudouridine-5'-phosphatase-like n=1 Tax=Dalotia coriaria TaxID=877792 RepID=UPI0031F41403
MPGTYAAVTHVLFDLDGLLIDSETFYEKIIGDIAGQYGKKYTKEVRARILGTPEMMTSQLAVELMELPLTPEEFFLRMRKGVEAELHNPPLLPGAEKLIRHLAKHKIPFAMATSGSKEATDIKLQSSAELFNLFHHKVMGSSDAEVKKGKPNPDIFLVCAQRFPDPPNPSKCLVFEDAPNGVKAAVAAGMQVVMVPSDEISDELKEGATLVLQSLEQFHPEEFGLPKFD